MTWACDTCPFTTTWPDAKRGHERFAPERGWLGQGEQHTMHEEDVPCTLCGENGSPSLMARLTLDSGRRVDVHPECALQEGWGWLQPRGEGQDVR